MNFKIKKLYITFFITQIIYCMIGFVFAQTKTQDNGNLEFIKNKNQWNRKVLFKADLGTGAAFMENDGITFVFKDVKALEKLMDFKSNSAEKQVLKPSDFLIKHHAYKLNFIGANKDVIVAGSAPFYGYYNYFIGNDKSKWASKVNSFRTVSYKGIYDETDLKVYESDYHFKYDFLIHAGAIQPNIQIKITGAEKVSLREGNLVITTSVNEITELTPEAYQYKGNEKIKVSCKFNLKDNILSFVFPDGYDKNKDLIIDPILIFSTYSGSTIDNWGFTATYDSQGNGFSAGIAFGTGYPTSLGAYMVNFGGGVYNTNTWGNLDISGCDAAIIKYDSSGKHRLWATYLGGSGDDLPHSMIVDSQDNLLIYGTTGSADFPVSSNAFDKTFNGGDSIMYDNVVDFPHGIDIYVSKLSADGSQLMASTYVGGTKNDGMNYPSPLAINYADGARGEIMIDATNNVYIASTTESSDFPVTTGAFQTTSGGGGQDGVIFKLNPDLSNLIWSSYIGGSKNDAAYGVVLDKSNNVYVTGGTTSADFPTTAGTIQPVYKDSIDGFITEIDKNGGAILSSTYFGSKWYDQSYLIDKDKNGNIFVYGQTCAKDSTFIKNAIWNKPKGGQFISKLNPDLSKIIWSTTFGTGKGTPDISPTALLVDLCNKVYISGWGGLISTWYGTPFGGNCTLGLPITSNAFQATTDNNDFYLMVMSDDASSLIYGTFFGSPHAYDHVDGGTSRFDHKGRIYQSVCGGCSTGYGPWSDFPTTPGAWSNTDNSPNCNNALFKFDFQMPIVVADFIKPNPCSGLNYFFQNTSVTSGAPGAHYSWTFGDGGNSFQKNPTHSYATSGTYNVTLIVSDTGSCNTADTITKQIIASNFVLTAGPDTTICNGGYVVLSANSFGSTTSYIWSTNSSLLDTLNHPTTINSINVNPLVSSIYYVYTSNQYCSKLDSVFVNIDKLNAVPTSIIKPLCVGDCNGQITVTTTNGMPPYHYSWNPPATGNTISNLCAGTYYVTVTDSLGCKRKDTIILKNPDTLKLSASPVNVFCHDSCYGAILAVASGGTPSYTYSWNNGNTSNPLMYLCPGTYYITATDNHLCKVVDSITLPASVINPPYTFHAYADDTVIYITQSTGLHVNIINGYTYSWKPATGLNNPNIANPIATPTSSMTYVVTIKDQFGCTLTDTVRIKVDEVTCDESEIFVPNAFTPNGDNVDDVLYVRCNVLKSIYFVVYDRWGEKVFETTKLNEGWDGTFRGRKCDPAVYDYYMKAVCINDKTFIKKGNITLIR